MDNILIVEDDPRIRRSIVRHLSRENYKLEEAENGIVALEKLKEFKADLMVLDIMMPEMNGYEVCKIVKADPDLRHIFVLMISAKAKPEDITTGLGYGADDYLTKPFDPLDLLERVEAGLENARRKKQSDIDSLTGLYNHYYFNNRITHELARCRREKQILSIVKIALEPLQKNSITPESEVGQKLMKAAAEILLRNSRQVDICARCRDDNFMVLLFSTDLNNTKIYAEKIRKEIITGIDLEVGKIDVSIGIASSETGDETIFDRASQALQLALSSGGEKIKSV